MSWSLAKLLFRSSRIGAWSSRRLIGERRESKLNFARSKTLPSRWLLLKLWTPWQILRIWGIKTRIVNVRLSEATLTFIYFRTVWVVFIVIITRVGWSKTTIINGRCIEASLITIPSRELERIFGNRIIVARSWGRSWG